jgi:NAD(P)H-nitrite reductase large subunit
VGAVRIEDVKAAGLAVDVDLLARDGFASISEEDRYRLKTQGVCAQRQVGVFMLRIRVPGGKASAAQLRRVADLAERYGAPSVHLTTRGGLEIHHVKIEDVTAVWAALAEVGLTTKGTCGDTVRNVIACSHEGGILPLEPFVRLLHDRIVAASDRTNISRKMNVALACSPQCDAHVATSDIGFVATPGAGPDAPPTFTVWGAGGLGATPRLAIELRRGLAQRDLPAAFDALVALGKKYGDRTNRAKAKIKLLVDRRGADRVRALFDEELDAARAAGVATTLAFDAGPASRPDRRTVSALVPMGELGLAAARGLADAAERYGDGIVQLTPEQNAELPGVREAEVAAARRGILALGLRTAGRGGIGDVVSCVGLEYCPLAVAHSMTMGEELAAAFGARADDARYADFRIHVSGCPHSCAKHQVADIGLAGATTAVDGERVEAYVLYLGGNAHERRLGSPYASKIPRSAVRPAIEALLTEYEEHALPGERFSQTVARVGSDVFFHTVAACIERSAGGAPTVRGGRLVVVGNGMTGARFVEELRERAGEAFAVTVVGDEPHGGYNRIMLSGVLGGFRDPAEIVTHPVTWYAERGVALRTGVRVEQIDRERAVVRCSDGSEIGYDALVLATGSRPLVPPIPGLDGPRVHAFRTLADCGRIRAAAVGATRAVVLGGGLLGLEAAYGLRALGVAPTVVHLMATLMEQQLDVEGGAALAKRVDAAGIAVKTNARAVRVSDDADGCAVELADGSRVIGDLVVVCCGIVPNAELARAAGLAVERGIVVDDGLQTSDPGIFAIGECAEHDGSVYGLAEPGWEQAEVLAERLAGSAARYRGSRVATKLKVAGVNVVALGAREARLGDVAVASIAEDGSYRRAIARDGVLIGAQVVGDAASAASFARTFDAGTPLPGSLAAFVFGAALAGPSEATACAADERVCICNEVARSTIAAAIDAGARDVSEIGRVTAAGTGCGTCRGELAAMIIAAANRPDADAAARSRSTLPARR